MTTRRLAAILAADVVGYSRLVSANEADALKRLGTLRRDIIEPNIAKHSGRLFKIMGDGFLVEFGSAVQAVTCAMAIQVETERAAEALDDPRKMRLRITGQLIDAMTGSHLWADKFEGKLTDVFALQDDVTEKVVAAIQPKMKLAEIELAGRRRPDDLNAYDLFLRALPRYYSMTREGLAEARRLTYRALEIDSHYGAAALLCASAIGYNVAQGWSVDVKSDYAESTRLGRLAFAIDENDPDTLAQIGRGTAAFTDDYDSAVDFVNRAVVLNPNSASAWNHRGWVYRYVGGPEEALLSFERAIRLSPLDPMLYDTYTGVASTFITLGRFDEAVSEARKALRQNPLFTSAYRCLAAALAYLGRNTEAEEAAARLLEIEPNFRISKWVGYGGQWQGKKFIEGLRLAGLPD